jgi:hypothetical protein
MRGLNECHEDLHDYSNMFINQRHRTSGRVIGRQIVHQLLGKRISSCHNNRPQYLSNMAAAVELQPIPVASPITIDGKQVAKVIRGELKERVTSMQQSTGKVKF